MPSCESIVEFATATDFGSLTPLICDVPPLVALLVRSVRDNNERQ